MRQKPCNFTISIIVGVRVVPPCIMRRKSINTSKPGNYADYILTDSNKNL